MNATLIGRTGAVAGKDYPVQGTVRIGAARQAEIRIRAEGVSRIHARLWCEGDAYWLEDAGSTNGTFLSGVRVQKDRLRHLDVVTLGRTVDLIFVCREGPETGQAASSAAPEARRVLSASLEPLDGPDAGTPIDIPKGEITLGRASSNNVVVESPAVSKVHARLERTADVVTVQDLASVNGTFVNDTRIDTPVVLGRRDRISLAGVRTFQVDIARAGRDAGAPASEPPSDTGPIFNQEWKTRLVWSAEELAELAELAQPAPIPEKAPEPQKPARPAKVARKAPTAKPAAQEKPAARAAAPVAKPPAGEAKPVSKAAAGPTAPAAEPPARRESSAEMPTVPADKGRPPKPASRTRQVRLVGEATHQLDAGATSIGRATTAGLRLDDQKASRVHAEITVSADGVAIEDKGSVNGTIVNGKEIARRQVLENGDRVKIGDTEWTVEIS